MTSLSLACPGWSPACVVLWCCCCLVISHNKHSINLLNYQDFYLLQDKTTFFSRIPREILVDILTKTEICFDWFLTGFVTVWSILPGLTYIRKCIEVGRGTLYSSYLLYLRVILSTWWANWFYHTRYFNWSCQIFVTLGF